MAVLVDSHVAHSAVSPSKDGPSLAPSREVPQAPIDKEEVKQTATTRTDGISEDPFELDTKYAYTPRKIRVITIGAGFSGLLMAHKFQHRFPEMRKIVEHKIFEMRSDVGGTWLANHYPGVQCDVPAHIYVGLLN